MHRPMNVKDYISDVRLCLGS